jgi:hypothetical protein
MYRYFLHANVRLPGDRVEDVDQDQEDGDQERHPARNDFRRYQKTGIYKLISVFF